MARLTKAETLKTLHELAESDDPEWAHAEADMILLSRIDDEDVARAYEAIPKWYA